MYSVQNQVFWSGQISGQINLSRPSARQLLSTTERLYTSKIESVPNLSRMFGTDSDREKTNKKTV
jgi:hypothetical protein